MDTTKENQRIIKSNEIRIGDYLRWDDPSHDILKVESISYSTNNWFVNNGLLIDMKPIPLTEEWLLRFVLKGRKDFVYDSINGFGIQIRNGKYYAAILDISGVLYHSTIEIKYVHQLQNLYFALTGQELELRSES